MELRHLRYFCAVAEELSFARAARRLFIAQPALSIQIRNLEEELGIRLFERTTRSVELTHAGRTFHAEAVDILARADIMGTHAREAAQGVIGTLRVAFLANVATADLGSRMRLFQKRSPHVKLMLQEAPSHRQIELLLRREIDAGLLRFSRQSQNGRGKSVEKVGVEQFAAGAGLSAGELESEAFARQKMIVAVPAASALAKKKRLSWKDLDGQPLILTADPRERYFDAFLACCEREHVRPVITQYAHELMTRLWLVACGFGFTPTTASSQEITRPGLCYRPLPEDGPEVLTFAAWRKANRDPHLLQFIATLKGRTGRRD